MLTTRRYNSHLTTIVQDNPGINWNESDSILDFIGAKEDGGGSDNWSYKTCTAPVN